VRYKGEGTLTFKFDAQVVSQKPGEMIVQVTPSAGGTELWAQLDATNPANYCATIEHDHAGRHLRRRSIHPRRFGTDCVGRTYRDFASNGDIRFLSSVAQTSTWLIQCCASWTGCKTNSTAR